MLVFYLKGKLLLQSLKLFRLGSSEPFNFNTVGFCVQVAERCFCFMSYPWEIG